MTVEADKTLSWSSDRPSVATVADGNVTGVAEGTAKITATSAAGGFTATCTVNVTSSMDQGTKVFTMAGDYSFYLNGDLIYTEINKSAFALEGQDVYTIYSMFLYKNGEKICSVPESGTIAAFRVTGSNAYFLIYSGNSVWLMTVDSTTGESRKTDFLEEQSAETIGVRNLKMAVSKDGTVYALTRTMDEYGEIHVCLYKISPGGNHTKTLIYKALGQVDSNGNPITGALEASPIGIDINDAGDVYYSVYKMTRKNHKDIYNVHLY